MRYLLVDGLAGAGAPAVALADWRLWAVGAGAAALAFALWMLSARRRTARWVRPFTLSGASERHGELDRAAHRHVLRRLGALCLAAGLLGFPGVFLAGTQWGAVGGARGYALVVGMVACIGGGVYCLVHAGRA